METPRVATYSGRVDEPVSTHPLDGLRLATCSDGAPSARNLLVTVFGDALMPSGVETGLSVRSLTTLLANFGVNERLVRTSLTRLVNENLLIVVPDGSRSSYAVAPSSIDLFEQADRQIYGPQSSDWDGMWTVVLVDAGESTAANRAALRLGFSAAGLGAIGPNVMASPVVAAEAAAEVVEQVGGFSNVLITRSRVVSHSGTLSADELARRCADVGGMSVQYQSFVDRFSGYESVDLRELEPALAFKLRILMVACYRRIVVATPALPAELLGDDWVGLRAREIARSVYGEVAVASASFLNETLGSSRSYWPLPGRFA